MRCRIASDRLILAIDYHNLPLPFLVLPKFSTLALFLPPDVHPYPTAHEATKASPKPLPLRTQSPYRGSRRIILIKVASRQSHRAELPAADRAARLNEIGVFFGYPAMVIAPPLQNRRLQGSLQLFLRIHRLSIDLISEMREVWNCESFSRYVTC